MVNIISMMCEFSEYYVIFEERVNERILEFLRALNESSPWTKMLHSFWLIKHIVQCVLKSEFGITSVNDQGHRETRWCSTKTKYDCSWWNLTRCRNYDWVWYLCIPYWYYFNERFYWFCPCNLGYLRIHCHNIISMLYRTWAVSWGIWSRIQLL